MSETTTTTAADVMGWRADDHGYRIDPTPDDMLAWLRERRPISFHFGRQGDGYYVDWGDDATHAPTLHAALEAAVIAVGSAQ